MKFEFKKRCFGNWSDRLAFNSCINFLSNQTLKMPTSGLYADLYINLIGHWN